MAFMQCFVLVFSLALFYGPRGCTLELNFSKISMLKKRFFHYFCNIIDKIDFTYSIDVKLKNVGSKYMRIKSIHASDRELRRIRTHAHTLLNIPALVQTCLQGRPSHRLFSWQVKPRSPLVTGVRIYRSAASERQTFHIINLPPG